MTTSRSVAHRPSHDQQPNSSPSQHQQQQQQHHVHGGGIIIITSSSSSSLKKSSSSSLIRFKRCCILLIAFPLALIMITRNARLLHDHIVESLLLVEEEPSLHGNASNVAPKQSTTTTTTRSIPLQQVQPPNKDDIKNNTMDEKATATTSATSTSTLSSTTSSPTSHIKKTVPYHMNHHAASWNTSLSLEVPQVVFDNLKYRRVCAQVHSSILCLVIRFPFDVPLQDPTVSFPKPFDERFYQLKPMVLLDGPALLRDASCQKATTTRSNNATTIEEEEKDDDDTYYLFTCLEAMTRQHHGAVVALWTRQRAPNHPLYHDNRSNNHAPKLYGTGSREQQQRMHDFFHQDDHVVMVLGASPTPHVTLCLTDLFGGSSSVSSVSSCQRLSDHAFNCQRSNNNTTTVAKRRKRRTRKDRLLPFSDGISIRVYKYHPTMYEDANISGRVQHIVNSTMTLMEMIKTTDVVMAMEHSKITTTTESSSTRINSDNDGGNLPSAQQQLRPLSIIVDFPLAHAQTHFMITEMWDQVKYNQERMVEMIMNVTTASARQELAKLGFNLTHLIVFDGVPQFFPTESGGYLHELQRGNEQAFLDAKGYPGWRPELGSSCRGPLPPNGKLRQVNELERQAFHRHESFNPKFYGKTWEFTNQFWWQTAKWWKKSKDFAYFDCVHTRQSRTGLSCVHKYFLQVMVDDHFETAALL
jgi:hypothetical protein